VSVETVEGPQWIHAEKVTLSWMTASVKKSSIDGMQFACEQAVETLEPISKFLVLVGEGTISRTVINGRCVVWVGRQDLGKTPALLKDRCPASHVADRSLE
jgi:hypothetical protein